MALIQITKHVLVCDGCPATFGDGTQGSAMELRLHALQAGWTFPPKRMKNGTMSNKDSSDACPECSKDWEPRHRMGGGLPYGMSRTVRNGESIEEAAIRLHTERKASP